MVIRPMKLVVGLGNPARKYAETRHNLGYAVLAELARKTGSGNAKGKFHGEVMEADLGGEKYVTLRPPRLS